MRIKWIYLVVIIIQVLAQGDEICQMKNQEKDLITIATGENYDFYLFDYVVADDLIYNLKTDETPLVTPPFSFMMKKRKSGIINDDVIEIISNFDEIYATQYYYCFQRSIQDDQIIYRLAKCKFITDKEMIFSEIEFFIKRDYCYQINQVEGYYYIACQDVLTNQLELIFFHPKTKLYQSILIKNVIIPPESKVKVKAQGRYLGVLINKGRIENNKYISENSQLYFFLVNFSISKNQERDQKVVLYKQYEVLNEPDDYVTDFAIQNEIALITRLKRGLTFRNLKIAWSNEIQVFKKEVFEILFIKKEIFGIYIPKLPFDVSDAGQFIMFMIWGEDVLLFFSMQLNKNYIFQTQGYPQIQLLKSYKLQSEQVFKRKVISSNLYVVFFNDDEFSIFFIDFTKNLGVLLIYQDYVKSKLFFFNLGLTTLLYEEQNVVYTLDLELPKIEIVDLTEIKGPQLLQIKAATFDKSYDQISCPDIKIYYQVQELNVKAIWPQYYKEKEQNVFILRYTKKEYDKQVDLSKVFLGQALNIEEINVNKQSKFKASFTNIIQAFNYIYFKDQEFKSVDYATTCLYSYSYSSSQPQILLFIKVQNQLFVMKCQYGVNQYCLAADLVHIQDDDIQDIACKSYGSTLQVVIVQKIKHGFVGQQIYAYIFYISNQGYIKNHLYDTFQESEGSILSITIFPKILIYTQLLDNIYTLNLREHEKKINQISSIELNCYKVFELACDFDHYNNMLFLPMIQYKNYKYYMVIEIYMIENYSKLEYIGSINLGQTKKPTKEKLQIELLYDGIIILQLTDISEDEQIKKLMIIDQLVFLRNFLNKKTEGEISIKKFRYKTYPTFNLIKINKIKTSQRFLYVYGSEIDVPACIYVYRLYTNQMDSLYHIIRTDLESFQVYNVISMEEKDLVLISLNYFKRILINPIKLITLTKLQGNNNDDDELIELKIKTLGSKDENNIQDFYIKPTCTDCESI